MTRALIFDFDGLILDTESSDYHSWRDTYLDYGVELPLPLWQSAIGTVDLFNPYEYLEAQVGRPLDRADLHRRRKERDNALLAQLEVLPGVLALIAGARERGMKLAVASSADHKWVDFHLQRLGLWSEFDSVNCRDDVDNRPKPDPAVYRLALQRLGLAADEAVALEDSPNGVAAARGAGIFTVAVPNQMTRSLDFRQANMVVGSLAEVTFPTLLARMSG